MPPFITLRNVVPRIPNSPFKQPIDWQINRGEIWAILGPNGSGKSILSKILRGQYIIDSGTIEYHFLDKKKQENALDILLGVEQYIRTISMDATYSLADYRQTYYQQRYNNSEVDTVPFISEIFHPENVESEILEQIYNIFNINDLLDRKLIHLSSGELRKFMIAKVVLQNPKMIIFDNPFIGLDTYSRNKLDDIFLELNQLGFQLLYIVPTINDLPQYTTHILEIDAGMVVPKGKVGTFKYLAPKNIQILSKDVDWQKISSLPSASFNIAVNMENVEISYRSKKICENINWTVRKGEKWALLGPNGSGKSTLLSCIFADNPIAYAKNLVLFDRKRGTGESIWDIKQNIGFTSSEMHLYYMRNISGFEVVESGFFDSIGLHRKCTEKQKVIVQYLMKILSLEHLANRSFMQLSSGEQRILLFARSLVKNPDLLILDEPYHGLDDSNKHLCTQIIDSYCNQPNKTLIYVTHHREEIPKSVTKIMELS